MEVFSADESQLSSIIIGVEIVLGEETFNVLEGENGFNIEGYDIESEKIACILISKRCKVADLQGALDMAYGDAMTLKQIDQHIDPTRYSANYLGLVVRSYHSDASLRTWVGNNKNTPIWLLLSMLSDDYPRVAAMAANNPKVPDHMVRNWLKRTNIDALYCFAHYSLRTHLLDESLLTVQIADGLASNENASHEHLLKLALHPSMLVITSLLRTHQFKPQIVNKIAHNPNPKAQERVSHLSLLSKASKDFLAQSKDKDIRINIACKSPLWLRTQKLLSSDKSHLVRAALANNPFVRKTILLTLSSDPDPTVRTALLANRRAPLDEMGILDKESLKTLKEGLAILEMTP